MIIKCPSCGFEQPYEGDYCPKCGGDLQKLLAEEKRQKKRELIKARVILVSLSTLLLVGYFLIFNSQKNEPQIAKETIKTAQPKTPVKLNPSKIVSRNNRPSPQPAADPYKTKASVTPAVVAKTSTEPKVTEPEKDTTVKDSVVEKEIRGLQLLDRFNCEKRQTKVVLNKEETDELVDCSQVVVSDIGPKETIVLYESEATVSMSFDLSNNTLEVILTVLIGEEPTNHNYFFNLPQTKNSTESVIFPIALKNASSKVEEALKETSIFPLFFKNSETNQDSNWSTLSLHGTF